MKPLALLMAAALALCAGCIASHPLTPEERLAYLTPEADPLAGSTLYRPDIGGSALPHTWTVRYRQSAIAATVNLVRSWDALRDGTAGESIVFDLSPAHVESLLAAMNDVHIVVNALDSIAKAAAELNPRRWSEGLAMALAQIEMFSRQSDLDAPENRFDPSERPAQLAGPLMELLMEYLHERSGRELLEELDTADIGQLRVVLAQVALRVGFDLAGKRLPDGLRPRLVASMESAESAAALETELAPLLAEALNDAPVVEGEPGARRAVAGIVAWTPRVLDALETLAAQWDNMDYATFQIRKRGDKTLVAIDLAAQPGREVRAGGSTLMRTAITLRGTGRIGIVPRDPATGETVVVFESLDGDGIAMAYEGIGYSLVRLFAVPLASGPLREIRVAVGERVEGSRLIRVAIRSLDARDHHDPRRLLVYQQTAETHLTREAFDIREDRQRTEHIFHYITPEKRYTFDRLTLIE